MKGKAEMRRPTSGYVDPAVEDAADRIPNAETIDAIRQVEAGDDLVEYTDMDEFMQEYARYKSDESQNE